MAEVTAAAEGVLALFGRGLPDPTLLMMACGSVDRAVVRVMRTGGQLSPQERARLASKLGELGAQLASLGPQLQGNSDTPTYVVSVAAALYGAARLAVALNIRGPEARRLGSAAAVLLGAGGRVLERAVRRSAPRGGSRPANGPATQAGVQLLAVYMVLDLLAIWSNDGDVAYAETQLFTPAVVMPWLAVTTDALQREVQVHGAGPYLEFLGAHAAVCSRLLLPHNAALFTALRADVAADAALRKQLVALLLKHSLPAAVAALSPEAAAAAVPGWRQPDDAPDIGNIWRHFTHAVQALLLSPSLREECGRQLEATPGAAAALRQLAVAMAESAALERPAGVAELTHCNGLQCALVLLCCSLVVRDNLASQRPSSPQVAAEQRADSWTVLRLLPKLAAMLRTMAGAHDAMPLHSRLFGCKALADTFNFLAHMGDVQSAEEAAQLLAAADTAVCLLPTVYRLWQEQQAAAAGRHSGRSGHSGPGSSPDYDAELAVACLKMWHISYQPVSSAYEDGLPPGSPAQHAAAAAAARRLQLSSCRALQWAASSAVAPAWLESHEQPYCGLLQWMDASVIAIEAADLVAAAEERRLGAAGDEAVLQQFRLRKAGAAAARWEALQAVFARLGPAVFDSCDTKTGQRWAAQLTTALDEGSAWPSWQLSVDKVGALGLACSAAFRQPSGPALEFAHTQVSLAIHCPPLLCALLRCGALRTMVAMPGVALAAQKQEELFRFLCYVLAALGVLEEQTAAAASQPDAAECSSSGSGGSAEAGASGGSSNAALRQQLRQAAQQLMEAQAACKAVLPGSMPLPQVCAVYLERVLPPAERAAELLYQHLQADRQADLEAAQAAAARCCAYLRCANLGGGGGAFAGQGEGSKRCGACRTAWYCGTACSHADWRHGGHKHTCKLLAAARQAERAQQAEQAQQQEA